MLFFRIFSYLPFLCFSDDTNFGSIDDTSKNLRFSLLRVNLGPHIIYILTIKKDDKKLKIAFLKCISFLKAQSMFMYNLNKYSDNEENKAEKELDSKVELYKEHLNLLGKDAINNELIFLKHKINQIQERVNKQFNIINFYSVALLALLPFFLPHVSNFFNFNILFRTVIIIISFLFTNIMLWYHSSTGVSNTFRSRLKELKEHSGSQIDLVARFYYDWYCMKNESLTSVGHRKNIQNIFISIIIVFSLFTILPKDWTTSINDSLKNNGNAITFVYKDNNQSLFSLEKTLTELNTEQYSRCIIQYNLKDKEAIKFKDFLYDILILSNIEIILIDNIISDKIHIYFVK